MKSILKEISRPIKADHDRFDPLATAHLLDNFLDNRLDEVLVRLKVEADLVDRQHHHSTRAATALTPKRRSRRGGADLAAAPARS
jgi:hypothetical protein